MRRSIEPSTFRLRDIVSESLAGIVQRPGRTVLTILGTVLGVGAVTTVLGLTASASGQISSAFNSLVATQVTVNDVSSDQMRSVQRTVDDFPDTADSIVGHLNGVVHAGVTWRLAGGQPLAVSANDIGKDKHQIEVDAASPGYLMALDPSMKSGVLYNAFHDDRAMHVAVLGVGAANQLGIKSLANNPAIFVDGSGYTVVGILADVTRQPDALLKVLIPDQTAKMIFGPPTVDAPASMLIETRLGAAPLIARQAPLALRPDQPDLLQAIPPPDPHQLRDEVNGSLDSLFLVLAAVTLLIGAAGIANTTLVAVMERVDEIGLRRALGARPWHVAAQFLTESTAAGALGGLLGTALGILTTICVALLNHWTAVLDPAMTLSAPLVGAFTGLSAGAYPALRASRIEPMDALRQ